MMFWSNVLFLVNRKRTQHFHFPVYYTLQHNATFLWTRNSLNISTFLYITLYNTMPLSSEHEIHSTFPLSCILHFTTQCHFPLNMKFTQHFHFPVYYTLQHNATFLWTRNSLNISTFLYITLYNTMPLSSEHEIHSTFPLSCILHFTTQCHFPLNKKFTQHFHFPVYYTLQHNDNLTLSSVWHMYVSFAHWLWYLQSCAL